jgi:hypothetical protein
MNQTPLNPNTAELFLRDVALLLDMPPGEGERLVRDGAFLAPSGLSCRVVLEPAATERFSAVPVVALGVQVRAMAGESVARLFALQAHLLAAGLWHLGMSNEGELQLVPLQRFATAPDLVAALDVTQRVACLCAQWLADEAAPKSQGNSR